MIPTKLPPQKHESTLPKYLEGVISEAAWNALSDVAETFEAVTAAYRGINKKSLDETNHRVAEILLKELDRKDGLEDGLISRSQIAIMQRSMSERHISGDMQRTVDAFNSLAKNLPDVTPNKVSSDLLAWNFNSFIDAVTNEEFNQQDANKDGVLTLEELNAPDAPIARAPQNEKASPSR